MNLVFSGLFGTPEAAFHRALQSIESIAEDSLIQRLVTHLSFRQ
jgi:hypothetical protein